MEETKVETAEIEEAKTEGKRLQVLSDRCRKIFCEKKRPIIAGLAVLLVIAIGVGVYFYKFRTEDIGLEGAKNKVLEFVNGNLLQPGTVATVEDAEREGGLYKITINIAGKQKVATYLTKDGKKFFPEGMDTDVEKREVAEKQPEEVKEVPKNDKPVIDLYVMSFCPFGNKAEDTLKPAYDLLKKKVDFNFHYIVSSNGEEILSLHGPKEVAQNEREACVLKNYGKDRWFSFVAYVNKNCGSDGACWETGIRSMGLSVDKINNCVNSEGSALMKENEKASTEAGAQGSPTMLINGVPTRTVYQYGNSEVYKQVVCDAFNKAPAECAKKLSTQAAVTEGGSCGN
ncbi:MAG: hypothetical protein Q8L10_02440 [Candidatus Moranbacteria bacterium]|nr:hypothetical protein [Candidatus Moranbacteria bacterium]